MSIPHYMLTQLTLVLLIYYKWVEVIVSRIDVKHSRHNNIIKARENERKNQVTIIANGFVFEYFVRATLCVNILIIKRYMFIVKLIKCSYSVKFRCGKCSRHKVWFSAKRHLSWVGQKNRDHQLCVCVCVIIIWYWNQTMWTWLDFSWMYMARIYHQQVDLINKIQDNDLVIQHHIQPKNCWIFLTF